MGPVVVMSFLRALWLWGEAHVGWILAGGLFLVALIHLLLWRRYKSVQRVSYSHQERSQVPFLKQGNLPRVSILIPAWNEAGHIRECLSAIHNLRYPNWELVLCAGGMDGTLELARQFAPSGAIILEQQPGEGKQRALQRSLRYATGSIIFLTDADCVLDDKTFERTLAPILQGDEVATTGTRRPLEEQKSHPLVAFQWSHHLWAETVSPMYVDTVDGVNAALRRDVLERVGGFSVPAPIGTDYTLSRQLQNAGYRIRFVPESRVQTAYCVTLGEYLRQRSRWFRNRFLHGLRYRRWREVATHLWAALTSLGLLAIPLMGGLKSRLLWALWLIAVLHVLFSQIRFTKAAHTQGMAPLPHRWQYGLFFLYLVVGWVANVRGLLDSLIPGRRWRW